MPRAALRSRVANSKRGLVRPRRQVNVRPTQWEHGEFVAVDGEGFSDGAPFDQVIGSNQNRYAGRAHAYAYLSTSSGREAYNPAGRLSLADCLAMLCAEVSDNPRAILVAFGGSYDVCHMVCHDLIADDVLRMLGKGDRKPCIVTAGGFTYQLDYRPRKCFTIRQWQTGERRFSVDESGKRKMTPHICARLWDVWGFFQDSFVGVLSKWCPGDPDFEMIRRMKGDRAFFERSEIDAIRRYNAAELRLLVKVMNRVRDAINDLGLKITRWDGAGAIAAAMLTKEKVKAHKADLPPDVFEAARCAYSGGHIEACKIGYHRGDVHHYDVNSAYPDQFRRLPSLKSGRWISGEGEPPMGYTLVKVDWEFPPDLPFYPLFYRCEDGSILYPYRGSGWYWFSEYEVAREYGRRFNSQSRVCVRAIRWHHFRRDGSGEAANPFDWVSDYYDRRQRYIEAAKAGGFTSGPEKIIKLGLNSLYGKTAQQIGARYEDDELKLPPFFQLDWAGFVTAGCRAKLMQAALQKPHAIIGFATDGLFSTEPLDLYCPETKELGAWEYKRHDGITMVMPGVYWLHDGERQDHYSRGFDKAEMKDAVIVHDAWRRREDDLAITITRLIGLGTAAASEGFWQLRGNFASSTRWLSLDGDNSKRYPINLRQSKPWRELVDTEPRDHFLPHILGVPESRPYPVSWIDGDLARDLVEGELADELEMRDAELA